MHRVAWLQRGRARVARRVGHLSAKYAPAPTNTCYFKVVIVLTRKVLLLENPKTPLYSRPTLTLPNLT
jgi:hypothetical protein